MLTNLMPRTAAVSVWGMRLSGWVGGGAQSRRSRAAGPVAKRLPWHCLPWHSLPWFGMPRPADPIAVDPYVVDTLLPNLVGHDRRPSAFLVYLVLWRRTEAGRALAALSLRELAEATGISKRAVQDAVGRLQRRRLISVARDT